MWWALTCTVCQKEYGSGKEWTNHLLEKRHQELSRVECRKWEKDVKECVIVVYGQLPVSGYGRQLMEIFSEGRFVTDFVVWEERPRVAFFQFESKKKVREIIPNGKTMTEIKVQNQRVQVKTAIDIMELEWDEFFPMQRVNGLLPDACSSVANVASPRKRKLSKSDTGSPPNRQAKVNRVNTDVLLTTSADFSAQYKAICKKVMIPDSEYSKVVILLGTLRTCIQESYPDSGLYLYRHWYLQMRNMGTNEVLIFLDTQGLWKDDSKFQYNAASVENETFRHRFIMEQISPNLSKLGIRRLTLAELREHQADSLGTYFVQNTTGIVFSLVTHRHIILETQTCHLLKYLCSFDPRAVRVLAVVNYWAITNRIKFSCNDITLEKYPFCGAEPISLEWLVMQFLCNKRVIPTVRQILERPHKVMMMELMDQDVGFSADKNFAEAWYSNKHLPPEGSEDFIKSVLSFAQEFFKFYSQLPTRSIILNTKDAEIIKKTEFIKFGPSLTFPKSSVQEHNLIKQCREMFNINRTVTMLHPLCLSITLSLSEKYFQRNEELIKITDEKLDRISFYSNQKGNKGFVDLMSLLTISC